MERSTELLAVSPETILRRVRAGQLPAIRIASNAIRCRKEAIEESFERSAYSSGELDQSRDPAGSVGEMERWHLPSIDASGTREPRVLFSQPEFRAVVIDLNHGDELGDHRLYEHSVLQIVSGRLGVSGEDGEMECEAGTLLTFAPKETRSLRALEPSRILLLLAPWPGEGHFPDDREPEPERIRERRKSAEPPHD